MVCSGMWCLNIIHLKPLTHIGFRCEVPTPSVFEGQQTITFNPHVLQTPPPRTPEQTQSSSQAYYKLFYFTILYYTILYYTILYYMLRSLAAFTMRASKAIRAPGLQI